MTTPVHCVNMLTMTNTEKVRKKLVRFRKKLNLTLQKAAPLIGVAIGTLSRFEGGLDVRASTLDKIAEWLREQQ